MKVRNTRYTLGEMEPHDRFYFVGDRKKTVYTIDSGKTYRYSKKQAGWNISYTDCRPVSAPAVPWPMEAHKSKREVIFLRNATTPPPPGSIE